LKEIGADKNHIHILNFIAMKKYNDEQLVQLFIAGSSDALDELISRHRKQLLGYLISFVKQKSTADDILQETFIKVIERLKNGKYVDNGKFASWLFRVAHNAAIDYLRKQRAIIDTLTDQSDFIDILFKGLAMCNDGHAVAIRQGRIGNVLKGDTLKTTKIITLLNQYDDKRGKLYRSTMKSLLLFLEYHKGNYYSLGELVINTEGEMDTLPRGAKILSIGETNIDSLITSKITDNWDIIYKKDYTTIVGSMLVKRKDTISVVYEYQGMQQKVNLMNNKSIQSTSGGAYLTYTDLPHQEKGFVDYFFAEKILYIRIPAMVNDDGFYQKEIIKQTNNKSIKKIIFDIRQNGVGSDFAWMDILSVILNDTLNLNYPVGLKNTDRAIKAKGINCDTLKVVKVPLLDDEEFLLLEWGEKIVPHPQTIGYTGKIYVLQDRRIYSAAGSLSNIAWLHDNIVSVGETTGKLLGFGVTPLFFTLPNSCFTFQLEPVLDLSNAETLWDYYHDNVEIPVDISVEQRVNYFNYSIEGDIYSKEFLFNHDPVFQKVLEQKD
jgi:RNA polymerase sigma factor (sigma-70 family)